VGLKLLFIITKTKSKTHSKWLWSLHWTALERRGLLHMGHMLNSHWSIVN